MPLVPEGGGGSGSQGPAGPAGAPGAKIRANSGVPGGGSPPRARSSLLGDYYLDTDTGILYTPNVALPTSTAQWREVVSLRQAGHSWHVGAGVPTDSHTAATNDLYLDSETGDVYQRARTSWNKVATIKGDDGADGTAWYTFTAATQVGPPASEVRDAKVGDLALNTQLGHLWEKTGDPNSWGHRGDITGPAGPTGPKGDKGDKGDTGPSGAGTIGITLADNYANPTWRYPTSYPVSVSVLCGPLPSTSFYYGGSPGTGIRLTPGKSYIATLDQHERTNITGRQLELRLFSASGSRTQDATMIGTLKEENIVDRNETAACLMVDGADTVSLSNVILGITALKEAPAGQQNSHTTFNITIFELAESAQGGNAAPYTESRAEWRSGVLDATIQTTPQRTDTLLPVPPGTGGNTADYERTSDGKIRVLKSGKYELEASYYLKVTETPGGLGDGWTRVSIGRKRIRVGDTETDPYLGTSVVHGAQTYHMTETQVNYRATVDCAANDILEIFIKWDDGGDGTDPADRSKSAKWRYEGAGRNRVTIRRIP